MPPMGVGVPQKTIGWPPVSTVFTDNRLSTQPPKSDEKIAPNTNQKMSISLIKKLTGDLKRINFSGAFCLCGYGEPMLHKDLINITNELGSLGGVEIITNGDLINHKTLIEQEII